MSLAATPSTLPPFPAMRLRDHLLQAGSFARLHLGASAAAAVVPGLVDVREAAPAVVPLSAPGWSDPQRRFLVRPEVGLRLRRAVEGLPSDLRLGFWEGLRPLPIQQALWEAGLAFVRSLQPGWTAAAVEQALAQYIARPAGAPPPHSTGSAVDVAAVDAFGRVLNPAEPWGRLGTEILARGLRAEGLASYEHEWWHWSYGDAEWARAYDCAPLPFAVAPEFDGPGGGI